MLTNPAQLIRNRWTKKRSIEALQYGTTIVVTVVPSRRGGEGALVMMIENEKGERSSAPRPGTLAVAGTHTGEIMHMRGFVALTAASLAALASQLQVGAQSSQQADAFIARAAEALGGAARIRAIRNITISGYGETAYMNGGGNISASPDAPQKWVSVPEYEKTIDLEHGRMRVRQRNHQNFVFAGVAGYLGAPNLAVTYLDGDIAWNAAQNNRFVRANEQAAHARRIDMFNNPVALVRAALDTAPAISNIRRDGSRQAADVKFATGETVTLATDATSGLPAWVRWTAHDENLGDVTFQTAFTGYLPVKGVMLPMGYATVIDFRNVVQNKLYVDKNAVDESIDDLAAPADVRSSPLPSPRTLVADATPVTRGVWLIHGQGGANSILFEFADHLTLFEAPSNQAWTKAVIDRARATVPGKPVTEVIVSHHHFDHTGGIREAMAQGLTVIAHKGTEGLFREIAARKGTIAPDAIGANPKAVEVQSTGRPPAVEGRDDAGRSVSRGLEQSHGGRPVRVRARRTAACGG